MVTKNQNQWLEIAIEKTQEKGNVKMELLRFWNEFYKNYLELDNKSNGTQDELRINELKLPESFDRLSILSDSLGLSYNCCPISGTEMLPLSSSGTGLRCLVANNITQILVEVVTQYNGRSSSKCTVIG